MSNWRLAKSLETLRKQINNLYPQRDKISDGSIGDQNHSSRSSDHNPNAAGIVCAIDVTHNMEQGIDCFKLAEALQNSKDKRIKYIIFNGQITQKTDLSKWKKYTGINAHKHHLHISVSRDAALYDDGADWKLAGEAGDSGETFYTVKAGDTVSGICKKFGLKTVEFYQFNDLRADTFNADKIRIGMRFRVRIR